MSLLQVHSCIQEPLSQGRNHEFASGEAGCRASCCGSWFSEPPCCHASGASRHKESAFAGIVGSFPFEPLFLFYVHGFLSFEVVIATKSFATFWCTELRYGGKPSNRRLASCAQGEGLAK